MKRYVVARGSVTVAETDGDKVYNVGDTLSLPEDVAADLGNQLKPVADEPAPKKTQPSKH